MSGYNNCKLRQVSWVIVCPRISRAKLGNWVIKKKKKKKVSWNWSLGNMINVNNEVLKSGWDYVLVIVLECFSACLSLESLLPFGLKFVVNCLHLHLLEWSNVISGFCFLVFRCSYYFDWIIGIYVEILVI